MAGPTFDYLGARDAGYTDDQILQQLAKDKGFDADGALKAGYTPQEIIHQLTGAQTSSTAADVGKSIVAAPGKAAVGLAGLPGDVRELAKSGATKVADALNVPANWRTPMEAVNAAIRLTNPIAILGSVMPTSGDLRGAAETVTGPWYDPQTRAGKIADTATQTALTMGRGLLNAPVRSAAIIAGNTAGTEGAGALSNDNPVLRMLGGIFGGGIPAAVSAYKTAPAAAVREALGPDVTPADVAAAQARQDAAAAQGVPLLGTESFDRGHALTSAVAASPTGGPTIASFTAKRPAQVAQAVNKTIIAPMGAIDDPRAAAAAAQGAATDAISTVEKARTAATKPLYTQAKTDVVDPAEIKALADSMNAAADGMEPQRAAVLRGLAQDLANTPNTADAISGLAARARDQIDTPAIGASSADRVAKGVLGPHIAAIENLAQTASPSLQAADTAYRNFTKAQVEPLTSGPVGVIAGRAGFDAGSPSAVPRVVNAAVADADTLRPENIRDTYTALNAQNPAAFPGVARTWIQGKLEDAIGSLRSGPNPTAGAKFSTAVAGTDRQQENFNEVLRGVAQAAGVDPDAYVAGANKLLQTLDLTGRTPGVGSPTATRQQLAETLGTSSLASAARAISTQPLGWLGSALERWKLAGNYSRLADVLTAPDSVQQIAKMAKLDPKGLTAQFTAATMLGVDRALAAQ